MVWSQHRGFKIILKGGIEEIKEIPGVREGLDVPIPIEELKKLVHDQERIKSSQKIITK